MARLLTNKYLTAVGSLFFLVLFVGQVASGREPTLWLLIPVAFWLINAVNNRFQRLVPPGAMLPIGFGALFLAGPVLLMLREIARPDTYWPLVWSGALMAAFGAGLLWMGLSAVAFGGRRRRSLHD